MDDVCVFSAETTPAVGIAEKGNGFASTGEDDRAIGSEKLTRRFGRKCWSKNATACGAHDSFRRLHTSGAKCTPTQY